MNQLSVNRSLDDKAFRLLDHALGQPVNPLKKTYRNYFCANAASDEAKAFSESPHWEMGAANNNYVYFHVTDEGRAALAEYLAKQKSRAREYVVTADLWTQSVAATSRYEALRSLWRDWSDCNDGAPFCDFMEMKPSARVVPLQ